MRSLLYHEHKYLSDKNHSVNVEKSSKTDFMRVVHPPPFSANGDDVEKVKETVLKIQHVGIREIAEDLNITYGSTQQILVNFYV